MRPIPYPISRPAHSDLAARRERAKKWARFGYPTPQRLLFGVPVCGMGWAEALTYIETISHLRTGARTLSFLSARAAVQLKTDETAREAIGSRILLPASRVLAFAARFHREGPLAARFDAGRFIEALLTFMERRRIVLVGVDTRRLEATRERLLQHAPWHEYFIVRAVDLGDQIVRASEVGIATLAPHVVVVDADDLEEEIRFEQALSLRHEGLIIMAGAAFGGRNLRRKQ